MNLPKTYTIEFTGGKFTAFHKGSVIGSSNHFAGAAAKAWNHREEFLQLVTA